MPPKSQLQTAQVAHAAHVARAQRLTEWSSGQYTPKAVRSTRSIGGADISPVIGVTRQKRVDVQGEGERFIIQPKTGAGMKLTDRIKVPSPLREISRRVDDANQTYRRLSGIIQPEYNLLESFTIYDTEPYVRQAIKRQLSLMFRNGFEVVGDKSDDVDYITRRLELMEYVMERDTQSFFEQILFNMLLASNCFLQKIRQEDASGVKRKKGRPEPVAGYLLIPSHMIFPYLENGVPTKWRRYYETGEPFLDIPLDDIIHLKWDVKPGHRFGTPRLVGVKDDIFALRRLEENVELLFINHLFPLFHIKVGTEEAPATWDENGTSETDLVRWQIENMPKEGVFVTDERVEVEVIGASGKGLDPKTMIEHYKGRIFTGLGMSALDMGDGKNANRATADNISQNLKDSIKSDLEIFGGLIRLQIFKDLFMEATYSTSVQKAVAKTSILFHEIDLDNKIKFENHVIQLFLNNLIDEDEARKLIGHKAFTDLQRKKLHFDLHVVRLVIETEKAKAATAIKVSTVQHEQTMEALPLQTEHAEKQANTEKSLMKAKAEHSEKTTGHKVSLLAAKTAHLKAGGAPQRATATKSSPAAKSVQNKTTPTNQHGSALGPMKAQSALEGSASDFTDGLLALIDLMKEESPTNTIDIGEWRTRSASVIDGITTSLLTDSGEDDVNSYTRQDRTGIAHMKDLVATTSDPDLVAVLVSSSLDRKADDVLSNTDPEDYDLPSTVPGA
jgi:hypothetical protein